jgi:hypothetical protein
MLCRKFEGYKSEPKSDGIAPLMKRVSLLFLSVSIDLYTTLCGPLTSRNHQCLESRPVNSSELSCSDNGSSNVVQKIQHFQNQITQVTVTLIMVHSLLSNPIDLSIKYLKWKKNVLSNHWENCFQPIQWKTRI